MVREYRRHLWVETCESLHASQGMSKAKTEEGGHLVCLGQQGDHVAGAEGQATRRGHYISPGAQGHCEDLALL